LRFARSSPRRCISAATCQPNVSLFSIVATTVRTRVRFRGRRRFAGLFRFFYPIGD
jgi:hypothetical protein